jgi:RNA polymerase sigma-70 factor (ECF subfamily)
MAGTLSGPTASDRHVPASAGSSDLLRRERFEGLFEACHRPVLAYAARRCPTLADAEDVVADVFVVSWRRLDDVPEGDEALLWLFGVARRTISNSRRGRVRRQRLQARLEATTAASAPAQPGIDEEGGPALEALARLSGTDQELLRLVAWEELTHAEIADVLGISTNAVAIRLHRARARFAEALVKGPGRWRTWPWQKGNLSRRPSREKT